MGTLAKSARWFSSLAILALVLSACASPPPTAAPTAPPPPAKPAATSAPAAPAATSKPAAEAAAKPPTAGAQPTASVGQTFSSPGPVPAGLSTAPVEITLWNHIHPPQIALLKEYVKSYQQLHPNVKVNFESYALSDYQNKLLVAMTTGTGPDVFNLGDWFLPIYIEKGVAGIIDPTLLGYESKDDMAKHYLPGTLNSVTANGKMYAVPYQQNSFDLWINVNDFKAAGLDPDKDYPKTWDDLGRLAQKLTKRDASGKITRQGFRWATQSAQWTSFQVEPLLNQYGASILDASGKCALNSPQAVAALKLRASFSQDLKVMDPSNSIATDVVPTNDFVKENVAMLIGHIATIDLIKDGNPEMFKNRTFKVVPLPQKDPANPTTLGYGFLYAYNGKATKEKQLWAQDLIRYLTSNPIDWLTKTSLMSPKAGWQKDPAVKDYPFLDVFVEDLSHGRPLVRSPQFGEISQALHRAVQRIELNSVDPQKSLDQACEEINRAVAK